MSIKDFFVKEKPVFTGITRGIGGFGFGAGAPTVSASGGVKFSDSSYTYHIFVQGDTTNFTTNESLSNCHILCVGGGGGGANGQSGGGGGSSVGHLSNATLPAATYTVTVGSGGNTSPGTPTYSGSGDKGGDSTFGGTTVYGGGGGLRNNYGYNPNPDQPARGGNGGGAGGGTFSGTGLGDGVVASQPGGPLSFTIYGGNNGAPTASVPDGSGGGGGGAGGASPGPSAPRPSSTASPGGAGKAIPQFPGPGIYSIMPSPLQSTLGTGWRDALGPTGLFGGGGGGSDDNTTGGGGSGGPGGGGQGGDTDTSSAGGINGTGGGAGSLALPTSPVNPGGGDGIVIVRYPV